MVEADISKFKKEVMECYFAALLLASLLSIPGKIQDRKIRKTRVSVRVLHTMLPNGETENLAGLIHLRDLTERSFVFVWLGF